MSRFMSLARFMTLSYRECQGKSSKISASTSFLVSRLCNYRRIYQLIANSGRKLKDQAFRGNAGNTVTILSALGLTVMHVSATEHSLPNIIDRSTEKRIIIEADMLYSQRQTETLYIYLKQYETSNCAGINWRLARAACDKAKTYPVKSKEREVLMYEAFKHAEAGLKADAEDGDCHRWYAVMLNYIGDYEGTKQKIKNSYIVRDHFKRAIELNPKDATSMHCLGQWCFFFAEMSWYTQKVATVIFGAPPTSSYEEALHYFIMAEKTDPNFYTMNHLMLARTYLALNSRDKAVEHLVKARDLPVKSTDDKQAHEESIDLLSKLAIPL